EFGVALVKIGRPQEAVQAFRTALRYEPSDMDAHYKLAVTLQKAGAMRESLDECRRLVRDLPYSAGAHYYLARALESLGYHQKALTELRRADELATRHPIIAPTLQKVEAGATGVGAFPEL